MKIIIPAIAIIFLFSCTDNIFESVPQNVEAYVPVYADTIHPVPVAITASRPITNSGKIYVYGNYIFQNEINEGIHIIDNTDRAKPQKIAFLNIPFNMEFAVKGNYIYANNVNDLVVIDISDITKPTVIKRMENAFPYVSQEYPQQSGYFVCPDPAKGIVVDWVLQTVKSPNCRH